VNESRETRGVIEVDEARYVDFDHSARLARFIHDVMTAVANRRDRPALADPDTTLPSCR